MSKVKRAARRQAPGIIAATWLATVLSLGLLYVAAKAVVADIGSFKSCSSNSTLLSISSCGKESPNFGDVILFGLLLLAACLTLSLGTAAWRMTRGSS